jgi:hypothetical protein
MSSLPSRRPKLSLLQFGLLLQLLLFLFLVAFSEEGITRNHGIGIRESALLQGVEAEVEKPSLFDEGDSERHNQNPSRTKQRQRELDRNRNRKSLYYEFLDGDGRTSTTSLSDVWLCLACALGWSIWLVSTKQPPQELIFEQQESSKAMGHVLQVSLGEDVLGTGIPVYYALIDYVVEGDTDEDHIQVRKVFASKKLLEEGFANVEVLYLTNDPTTAILMGDLLYQKEEREFETPHSTAYYVVIYFLSVVLIIASVFGGARMAIRLEHPIYGWISLAVGLLFLYPAAKLLYRLVTHLYSLAGPVTERPGVIVHGKRLYWKNQCHSTLNPLEILGGDRKSASDGLVELSDLSVPRLDANGTKGRNGRDATTTLKRFPNAGCGFGNFNVHLPVENRRTNSSVSSMSASASQNSEKSPESKIVRNDTSILEKYELHVSATEKNGRK